FRSGHAFRHKELAFARSRGASDKKQVSNFKLRHYPLPSFVMAILFRPRWRAGRGLAEGVGKGPSRDQPRTYSVHKPFFGVFRFLLSLWNCWLPGPDSN